MRTLYEIIEATKEGSFARSRPDYDELRYAVLALDALTTFDMMAFMRMARSCSVNKGIGTPAWEYEERFNCMKAALNKSPKEYVGWNNDPDNPDYIEMRGAMMSLGKKMLGKWEEEHCGCADNPDGVADPECPVCQGGVR